MGKKRKKLFIHVTKETNNALYATRLNMKDQIFHFKLKIEIEPKTL